MPTPLMKLLVRRYLNSNKSNFTATDSNNEQTTYHDVSVPVGYPKKFLLHHIDLNLAKHKQVHKNCKHSSSQFPLGSLAAVNVPRAGVLPQETVSFRQLAKKAWKISQLMRNILLLRHSRTPLLSAEFGAE